MNRPYVIVYFRDRAVKAKGQFELVVNGLSRRLGRQYVACDAADGLLTSSEAELRRSGAIVILVVGNENDEAPNDNERNSALAQAEAAVNARIPVRLVLFDDDPKPDPESFPPALRSVLAKTPFRVRLRPRQATREDVDRIARYIRRRQQWRRFRWEIRGAVLLLLALLFWKWWPMIYQFTPPAYERKAAAIVLSRGGMLQLAERDRELTMDHSCF